MALTRRQLAQLRQSLEFTTTDAAKIADTLYGYKVSVYEQTLAQFARDYHRPELPGVSAGVRRSLQGEADESAQIIVDTYNRDLLAFIQQNTDLSPEVMLDRIDAWARNHANARRDKIAVTETYGPHADATIGIFLANGIDAEFDFGGHGDDDPACELCKLLRARNPHPASRVVKIGTPHIQCRQLWHPLIDPADLPTVMSLEPTKVAGIVGRQSLIQQKGGMKQALRYVNRLK